MRPALFILALALLLPMTPSRAADTINIDSIVNIDRFGDGSIKLTFHLSASQWAIWRQQYGDHPDVLWRDLKQMFARFALDKFDLKKNDVERTADVNISARACTQIRGDGTREIEIPKDFRFVSNNGREWIFSLTSQQSPYSPILSQTSRLILPEDARNPHLDQPGTGSEQLVYEIAGTPDYSRIVLWLGIFALAGSLLFGILAVIFLLRKPANPPIAPVT
jgi:hypothetical protein